MMKGSEILIKELRRHGVDIVFGYPGASILSLYDELSRSDIRHILPADERGAAFMANGYARATNKVGVCIATSGPGATNLVTGIADAFSDSVPLRDNGKRERRYARPRRFSGSRHDGHHDADHKI